MTLRDALATARGRLIPTPNGDHNAEGRCPSCLADATAILADPAFRLALTEAIAEALYVENMSVRGSQPNGSGGWLTVDEVAAAIVRAMLP